MSSVWPSGAAFTTASVAILVPAPGRFSTTNCWPSRSDSHCPIIRATMSVAPPAPQRRRPDARMCGGEVSLDHLVGAGEQFVRHGNPEHPSGRMIDDQLELG